MPRARTAALLALLVLVAGCSGAGGGGGPDLGASADSAEMRVSGGGGDGGAGSVERDGGSGGSDPIAQARNRQLIYTATVELEVEDYDRARSDLTAAARQRGGFVSNANERRHTAAGGNFTTGTVTYRVPADEYESFLAAVNETGTVVSSQQRTEDVTDQLVDLDARLRTLRAQRDRLRELYEQANTTEEVLAVERRLSEVQTQIERAEARKASLERQVALSTVTVELREPRPGAPPAGAWYDTPLVEAFLASVDGVVVTVRALAVAGAYVAPYLLVFGLPPVAGIALAWRRWGGRGSTEENEQGDADAGAGADASPEDEPGSDTGASDDVDDEETDDAAGDEDASEQSDDSPDEPAA